MMADPQSQEDMQYSVGRLSPFDGARVLHFLVEVLGRRERIPLRFDLNEGIKEVEKCMRARYGGACLRQCARLLYDQLANSHEDHEIWGSWRSEYAALSMLDVGDWLLKTDMSHRC